MTSFRLLDTADIAALLGVKRATVTNRIIKAPGFPKPTINLSQRIRRWNADEVAKWVKTARRSRPIALITEIDASTSAQ